MSSSDASFNSIFSLEASDLPPIVAEAIKSGDAVEVIKSRLLSSASKLDLDTVTSAVADKVGDLLDMSLSEVMVAAWRKYELLAVCLDEDKYSQGESILVTLSRHTISSQHNPSIELLANDEEVARLTFSIRLALNIEGAVVRVVDKRVREIRLGEVSGQGSFKCGEHEIASRSIEPKTLPGSLSFDPGIVIPDIPSLKRPH